MSDPALIYTDISQPADKAGTHVLIIGVGDYLFGKGKAEVTSVGDDLQQLSSPPISARAMADWFIKHYRNTAKPLASVAMLLSESPDADYQVPGQSDSGQSDSAPPGLVRVPRANLANVVEATKAWVEQLKSNRDHMAVFYFCGHGFSAGDHASLLLEDFGKTGGELEAAIDLTKLCAVMKNSPAIQQVFLLDCCRSDVDRKYEGNVPIGSGMVSILKFERGHSSAPQQFVLFPTIDGAEAFGVKNKVSVFSKSILDALSFAAADAKTGPWKTTTGNLLTEVTRLVNLRLPPQFLDRGKPNALDASSFEFNEIDIPIVTRSFVTLSDLGAWKAAELQCAHGKGTEPTQSQRGSDSGVENCCKFDLSSDTWLFSGTLPPDQSLTISPQTRYLTPPVAYVTLKVQ
ncbi:caspase family protein [Phragmitibacter flavus]|uniref:Caspase family protein n=1 Tax=Phragmitibacter flavus TaxID=2576071 RepID=A0A5R8KI87_9BACT|nr:caspase family protein [Phragmitibacter flavus]TLD71695.1 caspase family protein [Phragmitibacter flavus]